MKFFLVLLCSTFSLQILGQHKLVRFEKDTLQLGDITRDMANNYTVHFRFKNISSSPIYFFNEATAWNDVADFSHYANKPDSVAPGKWGSYRVELRLGSKRWIHYYGWIIFHSKEQQDTVKLFMNATVHDSLLPIQQEALVDIPYPMEDGEYVMDLGQYNLCSKEPNRLFQFKNISQHIITYDEHAIIWDNQSIQYESKNWRNPKQVQPGETGYMTVEFRHPKQGPFDLRNIQHDTLPWTISAIDENGTLCHKNFYLRFTGTFYSRCPSFRVYETKNKAAYKMENKFHAAEFIDTVSDFQFITIFLADDTSHRFQLKRKQTPKDWTYIPFVTFNYDYQCMPPDDLTKMGKAFSYYWSSDERDMPPYKSVSIGYMVKNRKDLNKVNWNDLDFYVDGERVMLKDFIKEYRREEE